MNKVPFFTSLSDHLKFMTVSNLKSRKGPNIVQALSKVHSIYTAHGFTPKLVIMDGEFAPHEPEINKLGMHLNMTAANEHVPKIEQQIHVIKERVCCIQHTLPFKILPLLMLIKMINHSVLWLNAFPPKGRVLEMISPRMIVIGVPFDYNKHCKWAFGTYGQMSEEPKPSNTQVGQSLGAICLGPKGNLQGSYKFLNLRTSKMISHHDFTPLPMPQEVIDHVNRLRALDKQPELLTFFDQLGRDVSDLQMHDPSTAGVHSMDDDNFDNLENDPIAADDEVPYAEYPDEPGEEDPDEDPDGNDVEDPDPDEEPYGGFNDFDDPFDNDLDPFEGEVIDLEPEPNIKVEMVSEEKDLEEEEVAPVAAPRHSSWQKKKPV